MTNRLRLLLSSISILALLVLVAPPVVQAQVCVPHLTYVDLIQGGSIPTGPFITLVEPLSRVTIPADSRCADKPWWSALIRVDVPPECSRFIVWLDYLGEPEGWTLNIGDSETNDGFGGDAGSPPDGQNAELDVLDLQLSVWAAIPDPPAERLLLQHLALTDGALRVVVENQMVTIGQPFTKLDASARTNNLFFLPDNPVGAENRTFYVGLNRVIFGPGNRIGCGVSKALVMFE